MRSRDVVVLRSHGRCEAEVQRGTRWVRCENSATEVHHMLTRARGGGNLDRVGEIYHLIHLCSECHRLCDGRAAYEGGMLIHGNVIWDRLRGCPVYEGPDEFLNERYGSKHGA